MFKTTVKIDGMMCEKCEAHISDVIRKTIPNAKKVSASRTKGQATFISDEKPDKDALSAAIGETGYTCLAVEVEANVKKKLFGIF